MYGVRNLEKTIRFSLKSRPSEQFHWPEMSQIKADITSANLFNGKKLFALKSYFIKIRESIDIIVILHFYEKSTSCWYEG